jgi:hypothetical protein
MTSTIATDSTSTTPPAFTTTIAVGGAGHVFTPDVVQVPVGGFVGMYPASQQGVGCGADALMQSSTSIPQITRSFERNT